MNACVTFNPWLKQLTEFWWSWRHTSEQERVYCCFFAFRFCFDFVRHNFCASWIATTPPTEEQKIMSLSAEAVAGELQKYIFFYILVKKITTDHKQTLMTSTTSGKHCVLTFILSLFIWKPTQTVLQRAKDAKFFLNYYFSWCTQMHVKSRSDEWFPSSSVHIKTSDVDLPREYPTAAKSALSFS